MAINWDTAMNAVMKGLSSYEKGKAAKDADEDMPLALILSNAAQNYASQAQQQQQQFKHQAPVYAPDPGFTKDWNK